MKNTIRNSWPFIMELDNISQYKSLYDFPNKERLLFETGDHPFNLSESRKEVIIEVPLAGYSKENIKIYYSEQKNTLYVEAEYKNNNLKCDFVSSLKEIEETPYPLYKGITTKTQRFSWWCNIVNFESMKSKFENGLLTITIPKEKRTSCKELQELVIE